MQYSEFDAWIGDLKYKLNKTYNVLNIDYNEVNGMRIDFVNNFHYGINYTMLWNLFVFCKKGHDYYVYVTNMIDTSYLSSIKRSKEG